MEKKDFESFFKLKSGFQQELLFGLSHLFNRAVVARPNAVWRLFDNVSTTDHGGKLYLSQIPTNDFNADLLTMLPPGKSLIVSCNDHFELAGVSTLHTITPPSLWPNAGINEIHIPFTDFSAITNPNLIIHYLKQIEHAYTQGDHVFIHCKAGRARSALVSALLECITKHKDELMNCLVEGDTVQTQAKIGKLLEKNISALQARRPQVLVKPSPIKKGLFAAIYSFVNNIINWIMRRPSTQLEGKFELGVHILNQYLTMRTMPSEQHEKLPYINSVEFIDTLVQSSEFKSLWCFGFTHKGGLFSKSKLFNSVQIIMDNLYDDPMSLLHPSQHAKLNEAFQCINSDKLGKVVLDNLILFISNNCDNLNHPPNILAENHKKICEALAHHWNDERAIDIVRITHQLRSNIFLSLETSARQADLLTLIHCYLENPEHYNQPFNTAIAEMEHGASKSIANSMMALKKAIESIKLAAVDTTLSTAQIQSHLSPGTSVPSNQKATGNCSLPSPTSGRREQVITVTEQKPPPGSIPIYASSPPKTQEQATPSLKKT